MTPAQIKRDNEKKQLARVRKVVESGRPLRLRKCPLIIAAYLRSVGINPASVMVNSSIPHDERYDTRGLTEGQKQARNRKLWRDRYRKELHGSATKAGEVYSPSEVKELKRVMKKLQKREGD